MVYLLTFLTLLLAGWPIIWLGRIRPQSKLDGLMQILAAAAMMWFARAAGTWGFISVYLRDLALVIFLLVVFFALRRLRWLPRTPAAGLRHWRKLMLADFSFTLFVLLSVLVYLGRAYGPVAVDLDFPLRNGTYYVMQGGSSFVGNYFHRAHEDEQYALDLVKLTATGNRASGFTPGDLSAYAIYGDTVYSPCDGLVLSATGDAPDQSPSIHERAHAPGNVITVRCRDTAVTMEHLMPRSLLVQSGDSVRTGQPLARVGNSGESMEPHLHLSASRNGRPVAMRFDGRFHSLNSVIRTKP